MQINTSKYILFTLLLIIPLVLSAQRTKRKYITRTGDTTVVVYAGSTGLYGEDAAFLLDSKASKDYLDRHSRYKQLKEAIQETDQVADIVQVESKKINPSSGSLGFRIAQQNIDYLRKDQDAQQQARKNINQQASKEELTHYYEKFGGMPSYFINGIPVEQKVVASLSEKDVLSKQLKVSNTTTGNPNGEIWHIVTQKAYDRLGLEMYSMPDVHYAIEDEEQEPVEEPIVPVSNKKVEELAHEENIDIDSHNKNNKPIIKPSEVVDNKKVQPSMTREELERQMREEVLNNMSPQRREELAEEQRQVEELKREIEALQQRRRGGSTYIPIPQESIPTSPVKVATNTPTPKQQVTAPVSTANSYSPPVTATPVAPVTRRPQQPRRTTQQAEEIISFKDSPQEKARRDREEVGSMYGADKKQVQEQVRADESISEDTPKRSIRKIKERQRDQ